jgi:uncharacterized protein (DUF433 family)
MGSATVTLQLPTTLYARLQALAAREHSEPLAVLDRLVATAPQALDGLIDHDPDLRGGRPIISGTGTLVRTVVGLYKLGLAPEEISDELPLTLSQVYAALTYYHLHAADIEADLQADSEAVVMQTLGLTPEA